MNKIKIFFTCFFAFALSFFFSSVLLSYAADNMTVSQGSGKTIAADDIGGVLWQRFKLGVGADGSATDLSFGQAAASASLPAVISSDEVSYAASSYAESSITGSYTTALTDSNGKRACDVRNTTDADLVVSWDGGTTGYTIPSGFEKPFNWGVISRKESSNLSVKYVTNPTTGSLDTYCEY